METIVTNTKTLVAVREQIKAFWSPDFDLLVLIDEGYRVRVGKTI